MTIRKRLHALLCALPLCLAMSAAAQSYPTKPVHLIVPYAPGGGIDVFARVLAQELSILWGQSVVVDNRPGGGSTLGTGQAAKSAPDGYTLVVVSNTFALGASSQVRLPYDPVKDFTPVMLATRAPFVLGVNPGVGAKTVAELLAVAQRRPDGLNFASAGQGTTQHLLIELLKSRTGMRAVHIPYKGSNPAMTDLISGRVDALFATPAAIMPHANEGKLVALAVTSKARSQRVPGVPTLMESGVPDFDVSVWFGLLAPAGTPDAVVRKFHNDSVKVLKRPEVMAKLGAEGQEVDPLDGPAFGAVLKKEIADWADVVRRAGLKFE